VARGWLGVQVQDLTPDLASSLGLADGRGAMVASVVENSPALRAGFQQGDVILMLNGANVMDSRDLTRRVGLLRPGDRANFTVFRDGARRNVAAVIELRNAERMAGLRNVPGPASGTRVATLGLTLLPLNPALRQQYNIGEDVTGVVVTGVDPMSEAAERGIEPGDVIRKVGARDVRLPSDVQAAIAEARRLGRSTALFLVADGDSELFVALPIEQAQG
jgi:serine protease Do